ncbi:MAG TPA: hypothetical protein VMH90_07185 [Thermoplasmata archaeon]|nr:hypothetical protein [Thermoplasmata archaeon]
MRTPDLPAESPDADEAARSLAVQLTEFFLREGWDAVADPIRDSSGAPAVEVRSAEALGPMPGRYAPHRARWRVEPARLAGQLAEITSLLVAARLGSRSERSGTMRPVLPEWCLTE